MDPQPQPPSSRDAPRAAARPRLLAAAVTLLAAVIAAIVVVLTRQGGASGTPVVQTVSTSASAWVLPRLGSTGTVALRDFHGRPLVLDFFASWCASCRDELPEFVTVARALGGRVAFAGVDSEETGDGTAFARSMGITAWPLARDTAGADMSGLRDSLETIPGMPITAFYDSSGRLVHVRLGAETGDELSADIRTYLGVSVS